MSKTVREVLVGIKKHRPKKGGDKKHGRNKAKCAIYRALNKREKNKARKIAKQKRFEEKKKLKKLK